MSLNVELLLCVKEHILAHPEQVDMGRYGDCGSIGCIAFHICRLAGDGPAELPNIPVAAAKHLDFPQNPELWFMSSINDLFEPEGIHTFGRPGTSEHAARVAKHIDKFIAEYGGAK